MMKYYIITVGGQTKRMLASEKNGYLAWPGNGMPFVDTERLALHHDKENIERLLALALKSPKALQSVWKNEEILSLTLRVDYAG